MPPTHISTRRPLTDRFANVAGRNFLQATLLMSACAAQTAEQPGLVNTAGAERERDPCTAPRKASRLYIGLSEGMTLDAVELTAFEAQRIVTALLRLCKPNQRAADSGLHAALATGVLEITAIEFLRDDAGAAYVRLQRPAPTGSETPAAQTPLRASPETWRLELERAPAGWRLISVARPPSLDDR